MGRPSRFALSTTVALFLSLAARPVAAEEPDPRADEQTMSFEIWTAAGSADIVSEAGFDDSEFMFMTGVLGLARFAPFEVGLSLDVGGGEDVHFLMGPVFGIGLDIVTGLRAEGLLEIGGHLVDGIGYSYDDGASGDESAWLLQGGLRFGLSARIGRETPRVIVGGWIALFRDLTTTTRTFTYPGGFDTESWEVGGSMGLLSVRLGFEW